MEFWGKCVSAREILLLALLRKRNRLRRCGHLKKANVIANKIHRIIILDNRKNTLIHATSSDVGKLWTVLRKTEKPTAEYILIQINICQLLNPLNSVSAIGQRMQLSILCNHESE